MKILNYFTGLIIISLTTISCLDEEPVADVTYGYKPTDSVQIVEINPSRQVTEIKTFYTKTSSCENFFDYEYQILGNERSVMIVMAKYEEPDCETANEADSFTLQFKPESNGLYTFRFWSGTDENGHDTFIVKEIEIP